MVFSSLANGASLMILVKSSSLRPLRMAAQKSIGVDFLLGHPAARGILEQLEQCRRGHEFLFGFQFHLLFQCVEAGFAALIRIQVQRLVQCVEDWGRTGGELASRDPIL